MNSENFVTQNRIDAVFAPGCVFKNVPLRFERLMDGATLLKCSEFGAAIIAHI